MDNIIIIGGGGHAKIVLTILNKLNRYRVLGYTDFKDQDRTLRIEYLGTDAELGTLLANKSKLQAVLAVGQIGSGRRRQELWAKLNALTLSFPSLVSPDAIVNEGVTVGEAALVMDGVVINCGATIGRGAVINTNSTVEHDVEISDWVHIAPGATVCGGCKVGRFSMVGAGATIIQGISIPEGCVIGAGGTVVRNITEAGVYVGCPARRIK